uniref:Uncharacterized protein n=1 Tax=Anguilla anguilla TaxID=7936 RepID=A0A0E9TPM5_ANGAN
MHQYRGCLFLCHTKFPKRKQVLASKDSIVERKQYRNRIDCLEFLKLGVYKV